MTSRAWASRFKVTYPPPSYPPCSFAIEAMAFLERSDFTKIKRVEDWLLIANDGSREVFVVLVPKNGAGVVAIPKWLVDIATQERIRVDVIFVGRANNRLHHQMNVLEDTK